MTIISLKILVGYAKSTHRTLTHLCGMACQAPPVEGTDGPGDNGAGPSVPAARNLQWQNTFLEVDDYDQSPEDKGMLPWEPLAPKLLLVAQRLAAEGKDRPLTATVILTAVLPFSGIVAFLVAPVVAGDAVLQWGANTPVGRTVGHGTKNALEVRVVAWTAFAGKYLSHRNAYCEMTLIQGNSKENTSIFNGFENDDKVDEHRPTEGWLCARTTCPTTHDISENCGMCRFEVD